MPADRDSLGADELLDATGSACVSGEPVSSWIPTIVGSAPLQSADDTAVVVLTVRE